MIEIKAMAREPGYRTKVAVSSTDQRVDCVGACVGVRGNRIKNIVDELAGERIDIVRFSDDMQVLIPNALQPAEVEEVILCHMLGRAIVLVREDQLSLAIGRRGQNVRLASKLCGWDIEIMTREELDEQIESGRVGLQSLEGVSDELAERLVGEGFLSYDDLSVIEPDDLMEMGDLTPGTGRPDRRAGGAEGRRGGERGRRRAAPAARATPSGGSRTPGARRGTAAGRLHGGRVAGAASCRHASCRHAATCPLPTCPLPTCPLPTCPLPTCPLPTWGTITKRASRRTRRPAGRVPGVGGDGLRAAPGEPVAEEESLVEEEPIAEGESAVEEKPAAEEKEVEGSV